MYNNKAHFSVMTSVHFIRCVPIILYRRKPLVILIQNGFNLLRGGNGVPRSGDRITVSKVLTVGGQAGGSRPRTSTET